MNRLFSTLIASHFATVLAGTVVIAVGTTFVAEDSGRITNWGLLAGGVALLGLADVCRRIDETARELARKSGRYDSTHEARIALASNRRRTLVIAASIAALLLLAASLAFRSHEEATLTRIALVKTGATYYVNEAVHIRYSCGDTAKPADLCIGNYESGDALDTDTVGKHRIIVVAASSASDWNVLRRTYRVRYRICDVGSSQRSVVVRFSLCDYWGKPLAVRPSMRLEPITRGLLRRTLIGYEVVGERRALVLIGDDPSAYVVQP